MDEGHVGSRESKTLGPRWHYVIAVTKPDGGKGQEWKGGFKTEAAAIKAKNARLKAIAKAGVAESNQPLTEYLKFWLTQVGRDVCERSLGDYERYLRLHIVPRIGAVHLDKLTAKQIDVAYTEALSEGVSARTLRFSHAVLKQALARAVDWELVAKNVAAAARPPKLPRGLEPEDRTVRALTASEANRLLIAQEGAARLAADISIATGVRRGEALGFWWSDVNFNTGELSVLRTVEPPSKKGSGLIVGPPKTESSIRKVRAPDRLMRRLREHRAEQAQLRLAMGNRWEGDFVLCRDGGLPVVPGVLSRAHREARERAGLPSDIRFHDWRHTYATWALRNGVSIAAVSRHLGHSSVKITLDVYAHALPEDYDFAVAVTDRLLGDLAAYG